MNFILNREVGDTYDSVAWLDYRTDNRNTDSV